MNRINNSSNIHFTSLKPQKRLGEEVLREFKEEIGTLKSASNLHLRILKNKDLLSPYLVEKLLENQGKLYGAIRDNLNDIDDKFFKNVHKLKVHLVKSIKKNGNKANCWEDMAIVFAKLLEKGENPHNVKIKVATDQYFASHFTTVFGLKKGADIANPKTWGSKAMIVDAWAGIVKPATEAIEDLKTILIGKSKLETVKFSAVDLDYLLAKDPNKKVYA